MLCQYCNENEAENGFIVRMGDGKAIMHICKQCTVRWEKWYEHMRRMNGNTLSPWNDSHNDRRVGGAFYTSVAEDETKHQLQINRLYSKLKEAIEAERYEEAAQLRDELIEIKKEDVNV